MIATAITNKVKTQIAPNLDFFALYWILTTYSKMESNANV